MSHQSSDGKDKNRALFPFAAQIVDELREVFGDGVKVQWADENGQQIGNKGPDGVRPVIERSRKE
jgi:hypothetical protein